MRLPRRPAKSAPAPEPAPEAEPEAEPDAEHGGGTEREVFGMKAHVARFRRTTFLVPDYAVHRPVAERILGGSLVSGPLHRLVRDVLAKRPGSIVHAGTFFGDMLTSFSRKTPGTVYAFEPVLENYLFAQATLEANELDNVLLLHAALGSENGVVEVETADRSTGRHRGGTSFVMQAGQHEPAQATQRVPQLTVDQFAIDDLSLVQLDVEGYEAHVLRGAERSIAKHRPVVVVEDNAEQCDELLTGWDYVEVRRIGLDRVYLPAEQREDLLPAVSERAGAQPQ